MESEFPSNSKLSKAPAPEPKKLEKVTTGEVIQRKKPLGRKIKDFFTGEDAKSAVSHVLYDVVIPQTKDTVADGISQFVERKLFGEVRSVSRRGARGGIFGNATYSAYNRISANSSLRAPDPRQLQQSRRPSRPMRHGLQEIILETRPEAMEVLDIMIETLSKYERVSVADLFDLIGQTGEHTDQKWGWTDLQGSDIIRVNEGYLLDLPRPEPLD